MVLAFEAFALSWIVIHGLWFLGLFIMIDALFFTLLLLFTLILLRKTAVTIQFKGFSSGYYKKNKGTETFNHSMHCVITRL